MPPTCTTAVSVTPLRAAAMLDIHRDTFRKKLMDQGVFTVLRPNGQGRGRRCYIPVDEIELYGKTRDVEAVRRLRESKDQTATGA